MSGDLKAALKINIDAIGIDKIAKIAAGLDKAGSATQRLNARMRQQAEAARALQKAQGALEMSQKRLNASSSKEAQAQLRAEMKVLQVKQAQARVASAQARVVASNANAMAKQQAAAARFGARSGGGAVRGGGIAPGDGMKMPSLFALYGYAYMLRHALHTVGTIVSTLMQPAVEFQGVMAQVRIKGGFSISDTARLAESAKHMGRTSMFTPVESAQAQVALAASDLSPEQIMSAMPVVKKFSLAGDLNTEEASDALVAVTRQFDLPLTAANMEMIGGSLVTAANVSLTNVRDLLASLKYVGPLGEMAGQSPAETLSALSLMGDRGIKGSRAGTAARNMLVSFAKPKGGKATGVMLQQLGLGKSDVAGAMNDVDAFMSKVQARMAKRKWSRASQVGFFASFFGQYGMTGAAVIAKAASQKSGVSSANGTLLNEVDARTAAIAGGGAGALNSAYDIASQTPGAKLAALNARWETFKLDFGERVMPHAIQAIERMIAVVEKLDIALNQGKYDGAVAALSQAMLAFASAAESIAPALTSIAAFLQAPARAAEAAGIPLYGPGIQPGMTAGSRGYGAFGGYSYGPGPKGGPEEPSIADRLGKWFVDTLGGGSGANVSATTQEVVVKVEAAEGTKATVKTITPKSNKLKTQGNVRQ